MSENLTLTQKMFMEHLQNSKKRLKKKSLDCLLLHEINPFSLSKENTNMIKNILLQKQVKKFWIWGISP